jgi:hypothetical protein
MADDGRPTLDRDVEPERIALVWISSEQAVIVRWDGEPVVEHVASGVTPRRSGAGSVRRGPARPEGGGRVAGHGTKTKHDEELRRFLTEVSSRLAGLGVVEVAGRGTLPARFAELLRRLDGRGDAALEVTTRALSRRPSDAQLKARLRRLADRDLPRRQVGRYRLAPAGPTSATGRPLRPAAGRRTLRPARSPEWQEIDDELEAMLDEYGDSRMASGPAPR